MQNVTIQKLDIKILYWQLIDDDDDDDEVFSMPQS